MFINRYILNLPIIISEPVKSLFCKKFRYSNFPFRKRTFSVHFVKELTLKKLIKVLGTGCPKCKSLTELSQNVVAENNMDISVEKVENIAEILKYEVMATPVLVIDNKVVAGGRIPAKQEIEDLLTHL